ncbi:DNA repair protein RecN [bacterium]|nr:DNA repair protein RecN [candidate division CSSED10-310 bacterium]
MGSALTMLESISIKNFTLLNDQIIEFSKGLNIITGETGAGKSIFIQAIGILTGDIAERDCVRKGQTVGVIEGMFRLNNFDVLSDQLKRIGIDCHQQESVIFRREIKLQGRDRFFVNESMISKTNFQEILRSAIDINSQHQHQMLLQRRYHLNLFDRSIKLSEEVEAFREIYINLRHLTKKLRELRAVYEKAHQKIERVKAEIQEIDQAGILPGEKENLVSTLKQLRNADEIRSILLQSQQLCEQGDRSIRSQISRLYKFLQKLAEKDSGTSGFLERVNTVLIYIDDLVEELRKYEQSTDWSPHRLSETTERLHFIQDMEGKYKTDTAGLIEYRRKLDEEITSIDECKTKLDDLEKAWLANYYDMLKKAQILSDQRKKGAVTLQRNIASDLRKLAMKHARFEVQFSDNSDVVWDPTCGEIPVAFHDSGFDQVEFLLSANPGYPLQPLADTASGGELSRIMLALKQHFLSEETCVIIFDEVDAGIGGKTATSVGQQMKRLSEKKQIICVTHLPQIAVQGDRHFSVIKTQDSEKTSIDICALNSKERISEVARMLSGDQDFKAKALAESMLKDANPD